MKQRQLTRALVAVVLVSLVAVSTAASGRQGPGGAAALALDWLSAEKQALGLTGSDIGDVAVSDVVADRHTGVTHVYLQQRYRSIPVLHGLLTVNLAADGSVLSSASRFVANIASAAAGQSARTSSADAAAAAARAHGQRASRASTEGLVWHVGDGSSVTLAHLVTVDAGDHVYEVAVDAATGAVLDSYDLTVEESAGATAAGIARTTAAGTTFTAARSAAATVDDGSSYRVFPLPFESPSDGDRALVQTPADALASPFGWHDTDGAAGAEFTRTRGNNVHAYADRDANGVPDPGSDPDGGAGLDFDFPLDLGSRPLDSQPAMVTNLFYWNNLMHDISYRYGFDEASGNFQVNNYGRGGVGGDDVRAEAQDGSGRNNANFFTPVEGQRPRMQMFEWRSSLPNPVLVNTGPLAGQTFFGPMGGFGESLVTTGPISGELVYIGRGCDPAYQTAVPPIPLDPYLADPAGKIAMIDRGVCTFTSKVKKAQDNGALMVIVANNIAGPATGMGGADPSITIPSIMISLDDANTMKPHLPFDVTVSDGTGGAPDRDSDIDAGVIAHEYGHGISNRLTGGPTVSGCLSNAEQMGEGWSDWWALVLTTHPSDNRFTARGVGTYVSFQPPDGLGIRPTQYTTDMSVNPSTYASVADTVNISQPHGIGYVWNTMLWEMYWNLVEKYGYNADVYADWTTGGNNLAIQLVTDGMKFQPCRPGFVDGRDAILAADTALTGGENQCEIWRAFAKRGLGGGASQGDSNSRTDGVEAFDLPASCTSATFGAFIPPTESPPAVNVARAGSTVAVKFTLSGGGDSPTIDSQPVDCTTLVATGEAPSPLASPGTSGLSRDGDEYHVNWRTESSWAGSCRKVTLRIPAASDPVAYFRFR